MIRPYKGIWPKRGERVYVDASAQVIGEVELGDHSSVWMNAVVRGDVNWIKIGPYTNIQDSSVVHVYKDTHPTDVQDHVTVGHSVTLHGCKVGSFCLIGMGAILLNGVDVGRECIVAAGSLLPEGMRVPPGSLVMGSPAKIRRPITDEERRSLRRYADNYFEYKETYLEEAVAAAERG